MRLVITLALFSTLIGLTGCKSASPRGGGGGEDEGFSILVPGGETAIKQGETRAMSISLARGENFKRDVQLEFRGSEGIRVDPDRVTIRASDKAEAAIRVSAGEKAALGEYRVHVTGRPERGEATSVEFKVQVVRP